LIVPKKHIPTFVDLDEENFAEMLGLARELVGELKISGKYKLVINGGENQLVPHVHMHLLGGKMKGSV